MQVKYVYNEAGEKESVIIAYKDWQRIRPTINETESKGLKESFNPNSFRGIYKDLNIDPEKESKALREDVNP